MPDTKMNKLTAAAMMLALVSAGDVMSQVDNEVAIDAVASFTEEQVAAGLAAYQANCSQACHQNDMAGNGPIASLRGPAFTSVWNNRTVAELIDSMRSAMPPTNVGGLPQQTYVDLAAFILSANGGEVGEAALLADSTAYIRQFTTAGGTPPWMHPWQARSMKVLPG